MNIKKLLMIASISLQFSTIMHAFSQDAYNAAFYAFNVRFNTSPTAKTNTYKQSAAFVAANGNNYSRSDCAKISDALGTPEAKAVGFFLADGQMSSKASSFKGADGLSARDMSDANIQTAFAAAPDILPTQSSSVSSSTQQSTQPSSGSNSQLSDAAYSAPVWARTLASFGGGKAVYDKAASVPKTLNPNLSNENFYNNAKVLVQYFSKPAAGDFSGVLNPTDLQYLQRAFSEAGVTMAPSNPSTNVSTPAGPAATVAANLKAQIESSKVLYNQYLQSVGQAPLYVAQ